MKHRVLCMVSGKKFYFECYAMNRDDAIRVARSQYPNARIMSANIVF